MTPALCTLAFGELEPAGAWGVALVRESDGPSLTALGAGEASSVVPDVRFSADADGEGWRLGGDAAALVVAPAGEAVAVRSTEDAVEGWEQLCRVTGSFERGGMTHAVDCLGLRSWWSDAIDVDRYESIRSVSAWFEPGEGTAEAMALTAFRPRKAKAHDRDVLAAAVIAADVSGAVEDPRLSTTYEGEGWPARAGLELWLAGEEPDHQYPRRASGEATGPRVEALADGHEVRAQPFRWHSRGREGAGMYLLARRL
jgi:hypothetical protein